MLSLAIGQGENSQTIVNMARFYTALATDGSAAGPRSCAASRRAHEKLVKLTAEQMDQVRAALAGVVEGGRRRASAIKGVQLAGKTGTAQSGTLDAIGKELNHAWFVGFAPADDPKIVVAVMIEFGGHGTRAARASRRRSSPTTSRSRPSST